MEDKGNLSYAAHILAVDDVAHFTKDFSIVIPVRWKFLPNSNDMIDANSLTGHDSSAVVSCAKGCTDIFTKNGLL